jgi:eukaryotic-like serine/threonine-protein kinase
VLPLEGDRKPVPFLVTQFDETDARFSPDGRWVAYSSDEAGGSEIYVRSFSMNATGTAVDAGGKWQVSKGCGQFPRWRSDGRELFYRCDQSIMLVEIETGREFKPGELQRLGVRANVDNWWGVAPDGKRFLVASTPEADKPQPYTVVLNWQAGLKR